MRKNEQYGPTRKTRAGQTLIGTLMAAGMDYDSARDEARLINMRNYQARRYREDPVFRERVKQRRRNDHARQTG